MRTTLLPPPAPPDVDPRIAKLVKKRDYAYRCYLRLKGQKRRIVWLRTYVRASAAIEKIDKLFMWHEAFVSNRPAHRKLYDDMSWDKAQLPGPPRYQVDDIVSFMVGGFGVIEKVSWSPESGWAPSYSTREVPGLPEYGSGKTSCVKCAWHLEVDFKERVGHKKVTVEFEHVVKL